MSCKSITDIERILNEAGIEGVSEYIAKLYKNSKNDDVFYNMCLEAHAALMFQKNDFSVKMREKPDLHLELTGACFYAEVTHFRRKDQDRIDDGRTRAPGDLLVPVGNTVPCEGIESWYQVVQVAERKAKQYPDDASTVLVIASSSDFCVGEGEVLTAADIIEKTVRDDPSSKLCRLGGLLLIDLLQLTFDTAADAWKNVYFFPLVAARPSLPDAVCGTLDAIRTDQDLGG